MSSLTLIVAGDSDISDVQSDINQALGDVDVASVELTGLFYINDKNRAGLTYTPDTSGAQYANDWEVIADSNDNMTDLVDATTSAIAKQQANSATLVPTQLIVCYQNSKHRVLVALGPAKIVGVTGSDTYSIASFSKSKPSDLMTTVNDWLSKNSSISVVDTSYYYAKGDNRCWVLYTGSETYTDGDLTPQS